MILQLFFVVFSSVQRWAVLRVRRFGGSALNNSSEDKADGEEIDEKRVATIKTVA